MRVVLITVVIIAAAAVLPGAKAQQQESVAEAARKARAQKKTSAKPAKVLTDEDLLRATKRQPGDSVGSSGATGATDGQAQKPVAVVPAGQTADGEKDKEKGEKFWRQRFGEAYNKLHLAEAELNVLEREWSKGQVEYYSDPQKALKEQYTRKDINEHQQKIDAKKKEIEQLHQAIANLEDELRRSGGDAGWAREP